MSQQLHDIGEEYTDAAGHRWRVSYVSGHDGLADLVILDSREGVGLVCDNRTMTLNADDPKWAELKKLK